MVNSIKNNKKTSIATKKQNKSTCTPKNIIKDFRRLNYMTQSVEPVYTGIKTVDKMIDRGLNTVIDRVPNVAIKYGLKAAKFAPKAGAYAARAKIAKDKNCKKKK